jgi:hypothetical protein
MIVFLDIDGVLNSTAHLDYRESADGQQRNERILSALALHGKETIRSLIQLDESRVAILQKFAFETGCKFVISSTWRENQTPQYFENLFLLCGYAFPENSIIGCTPVLDHIKTKKRGNEIQQWLSDNSYAGKYAILDDCSPKIFLDGQPLVQTSYATGINEQNVADLKHILGL